MGPKDTGGRVSDHSSAGSKTSPAGEFPGVDYQAWCERVTADLRGRDPNTALGRQIDAGLRTRPLHAEDDGDVAAAREVPLCGEDRGWRFASTIASGDPETVTRWIRDDRHSGVQAFWFRFDRPERLRRVPTLDDPAPDGLFGLKAESAARALSTDSGQGGESGRRALILDAGASPGAALDWALDAASSAPLEPSEVDWIFGVDVAASLARDGMLPGSLEAIDSGAVELVSRAKDLSSTARAFSANALPYHLAGAGYAEAIGFALASAVRTMRTLISGGIPASDAARQIAWTVPVTGDLLVSLSTVRAVRRLWARVQGSFGVSADPSVIHSVTSARMLARRDPWSNALRLTNAAVAAVLGGTQYLSILPFDHALEIDPAEADVGRRLARNTSYVLREEARLHEVLDPTGGSWCVESMTDQIERQAYSILQEVERDGGIVSALTKGSVQARCSESAARLRNSLAVRKDVVVGVNQFAVVDEPDPPERRRAPRDASEFGFGEREAGLFGTSPIVERLSIRRDVESFEALREVSSALARSGARPRVAIVGIGPLREWKARADFVVDLLAAGGVQTVWPDLGAGEMDVSTTVAAFQQTSLEVACICAKDERVEEVGATLAAALKAAGAREVLVAGRPGSSAASLEEAGVGGFVHIGVDACQLLSSLLATAPSTRSPSVTKQGARS